MTRSRLLSGLLFLAATALGAHAQTFRPAGGPWTRAHELVGATPDGRVFARVGQRLGVTTDAGQTWTVVSETTAPTRIAGSGNTLYGAFPNGVRLSTDGGATWAPFGLDGQSVRDVAVGAETYALTASAVYRLSAPAAWQPVPLPADTPSGTGLSHLGAAGGTVAVAGYILQCSGNGFRAVFFRSRDGGATWARSDGSGLPSDVAVAPDGTAYFATVDALTCLNQTTPGGLFEQAPGAASATLRSGGDTGGVAVDAAGQPVTVADGQASEIALASGTVVYGTRPLSGACFDPPCGFTSPSGLYALRDGRAEPVGFERSAVRALTQDAGTPVVPSDGAVYRLVAGRFGRGVVPLGDVRAFVALPWSPGTTLALSGGGPPPPDSPSIYTGSFPLVIPFGGSGQVPGWSSDVATASATVSGARILSASVQTYRSAGIFVMAESDIRATLTYRDLGSVGAVGETTVYAGAVDGVTSWGNAPPARIFRSDDRGDTWTPDDAGMTARDVFAFTSVGTGAARLDLAGTNAGVFARTPGAPWTAAGLDGRRVLTFYAAPDGLLAGTDDGLFRRDAAGAWIRYGAGLDGRTVYAVLTTTDAFGAWLGVGTDAGLYQTRAFGVASEAAVPLAEGTLRVTTRPNPSGGARAVGLDGLDGAARVSVFDLLGRRVADLGVVAPQGARAEAAWDASALPVGVYVVRATTASGRTASVRAAVLR